MKKFSKIYLIILTIFIVGGILGRFIYEPAEEDAQQAEQDAASEIPGYNTMLHIHKVAEQQQLEEAILNIEITQEDALNAATVHMQSNDYMNEDVLLKDSYNMLSSLVETEKLASITFIWYKPKQNKNEQFLSFTLNKDALQKIKSVAYKDIPALASSYITY